MSRLNGSLIFGGNTENPFTVNTEGDAAPIKRFMNKPGDRSASTRGVWGRHFMAMLPGCEKSCKWAEGQKAIDSIE